MKSRSLPIMLPEIAAEAAAHLLPPPARTLRYVGSVTRQASERALKEIEKLIAKDPLAEVGLFISSPGGTTGAAMSFFDTVRQVLKPALVTIGSGDVDSSGVIILLAGDRRYLTKNTTMLLHSAGRYFSNQRYTVKEMEAMLAEDRLKDAQYAALLAERSRGGLSTEKALALMEAQTVLSPARAVELGLADAVLR